MAFCRIILKRRWTLCVVLGITFSVYIFWQSIQDQIQDQIQFADGNSKGWQIGRVFSSGYMQFSDQSGLLNNRHDLSSTITNSSQSTNRQQNYVTKSIAPTNGYACQDNCMEVQTWLETKSKFYRILSNMRRYCNGSVVLYESKAAMLYDMVVDGKAIANKIGGEYLEQVIGQTEEKENIHFKNGAFNIGHPCSVNDHHAFAVLPRQDNTLYPIFSAMSYNQLGANVTTCPELTIAIQRREYANLYWTIIDFYNVFLVSKAFGIDVSEMKVLFVDGHPEGKMDPGWETIFGTPLRIGKLNTSTRFKKLFILMDRRDTPILEGLQSLPFVSDFRNTVYKKFQIEIKETTSCKNISILFILRRNYVAHPRNPSGRIRRKITNEEELLKSTRLTFPNYSIKGIQMDNITMDEQIHLLSSTNILIGMHGAGLAHVMLLRPKSGLIELFPMRTVNDHFETMARWSDVFYTSWRNADMNKEDQDQNTYIIPATCVELVKKMVSTMCK